MIWRRPGTRLSACATLGLVGSLLAAIAAPRALDDPVVAWWYPAIHTGRAVAMTLVWVGMGLLAIAWVAVGLQARGGGEQRVLSVRRTVLVAALWTLPLALAPPLFSRDVYSYLAQGTILHLGHNPYLESPSVLPSLGHRHLLDAVSPFWRHTTAPYGPLFLELTGLFVAVCGGHLVGAVLLCRALDLVGMWLLAVHVPRIARALGADGPLALWLTIASPLMLLGLVAPSHNDLLMAGLLAAGVAYALRGNPLLGVAVCALAGTIKLPALVGAVFITVCWARSESGPGRTKLVAEAIAITVAVLAAVTLASGAGVGWLSSSVFSTPAKVRLAITPATALGETIALILHGVGVGVGARGLEATVGAVATVLVACVGVRLLWRARVGSVAVILGATLLLAAAGGPAAWPWYLSWGLVLLCACPGPQRSPFMLAIGAIGPFVVRPDGILTLPITASPVVLGVYLVLAAVAWRRWRRPDSGAGGPGGSPRTSPAGRPGSMGPVVLSS